jgi:hypothetical protein
MTSPPDFSTSPSRRAPTTINRHSVLSFHQDRSTHNNKLPTSLRSQPNPTQPNPTMPTTNFFFQPHVLLPSIGKSESTDSTIDVKQSKATSVLRSHTRSPSPPRAVSTQSDIWRTSATPVCRTVSNSSREEQGFDLWAIRRCDAFDEDEDDC